MSKTSFFAPAKLDKKQARQYHFINVGTKPFHALAVAYIDLFQNSTRINEPGLKTLLARLYVDFPELKPNQAYLTPADRMRMLIDNSRKSDMVERLAHVFRNLAVDELYKNPLDYRDVFDGLTADTSTEYLRKSDSPVPASVLRSLTRILGLNIILSYKEPGKELRMREVYTANSLGSPTQDVVIQVQGAYCFPRVTSKDEFAYVGHLPISPLKSSVGEVPKDSTLAAIIETITEDNKGLLSSYNKWHRKLSTMVAAGELSKFDLMDLYVQFLPMKVSMGVKFFNSLSHIDQPVTGTTKEGSDQAVCELLVDSLSRGLCMRQIDSDALFEQIEKPSSKLAL